jgi:hypothetical protein
VCRRPGVRSGEQQATGRQDALDKPTEGIRCVVGGIAEPRTDGQQRPRDGGVHTVSRSGLGQALRALGRRHVCVRVPEDDDGVSISGGPDRDKIDSLGRRGERGAQPVDQRVTVASVPGDLVDRAEQCADEIVRTRRRGQQQGE